MIEEKAADASMAAAEIDDNTIRLLQHLVLSHHERPEYGAARKPVTPEAHVLALIDRLDATLNLNK